MVVVLTSHLYVRLRPFITHYKVASIEQPEWGIPGGIIGGLAQPPRAPDPSTTFSWSWGIKPVVSSGAGWTPVAPFLGQVDGAKWKRRNPNTGGLWFAQHWSVEQITVTSTPLRSPNDTSLWNVECRIGGGDAMATPSGMLVPLTGEFQPLTGKLWGSDLGVLVINDIPWQKDRIVTTMLRFNQATYGPSFAAAPAVAQKPKHFPVTDCYTGGDTDYANAQWGLAQMDRIGFHGLCYDVSGPSRHVSEILKALGQDLTIGALPNGAPFVAPGTGGTFNSSTMAKWAAKAAAPYTAAGWNLSRVASIAIADEPGWEFPAASPERHVTLGKTVSDGAVTCAVANPMTNPTCHHPNTVTVLTDASTCPLACALAATIRLQVHEHEHLHLRRAANGRVAVVLAGADAAALARRLW